MASCSSTSPLAGIINAAGTFASSSQAENAIIHHDLFSFGNDFNDITYGTYGLNAGNFPTSGWDFCTGVGSDHGFRGK